MKVNLRDIKLFDLDSHTLVVLSRFVVLARKHENQTLRLNDNNVLEKVFAIGSATENAKLKILFLSLRSSLKEKVSESEFKKYSLPAAHKAVNASNEILKAS
ncbi:hypothetical protein NBRC116583_34150 [Arenicella sp. 4NH20-0111]|uniref:hypothetical protein n=1 Tax=Arenicella sp. 4NH20-0111 TaxID=3127648 RepID=UPI003105635C